MAEALWKKRVIGVACIVAMGVECPFTKRPAETALERMGDSGLTPEQAAAIFVAWKGDTAEGRRAHPVRALFDEKKFPATRRRYLPPEPKPVPETKSAPEPTPPTLDATQQALLDAFEASQGPDA